MTGKWHVKAKAEQCFDVVRNLRGGMPNQTAEGYNRPLPGKPDPWSPYDPKFEGFWKGGKHWSEVVADDALFFFKEATKHRNENLSLHMWLSTLLMIPDRHPNLTSTVIL